MNYLVLWVRLCIYICQVHFFFCIWCHLFLPSPPDGPPAPCRKCPASLGQLLWLLAAWPKHTHTCIHTNAHIPHEAYHTHMHTKKRRKPVIYRVWSVVNSHIDNLNSSYKAETEAMWVCVVSVSMQEYVHTFLNVQKGSETCVRLVMLWQVLCDLLWPLVLNLQTNCYQAKRITSVLSMDKHHSLAYIFSQPTYLHCAPFYCDLD